MAKRNLLSCLFFLIMLYGCDDVEVETTPEGTNSPSIFVSSEKETWYQDENIQYSINYRYANATQIQLSVVEDGTYTETNHPTKTITVSGDGSYTWNINPLYLEIDIGYRVKATWNNNNISTSHYSYLIIRESVAEQNGSLAISSLTETTYNTNNKSKFIVPLEVDMGTLSQERTYFMRCYLQNKETKIRYQFNDVSFVHDGSYSFFEFDKEYGGSLPHGQYELQAQLLLDGGTIAVDADEYKNIMVYGFDSDTYTKEVTIEYDCHSDHNFYSDYKDEMDFKTKQAFDPVYFKIKYEIDETTLVTDEEHNDQINATSTVEFAKMHDIDNNDANTDTHPHIIFMGAYINQFGDVDYNNRGIAAYSVAQGQYPYIYIFLDAHRDGENGNGNLEENDVYKTIIHELGHGLGDLRHASVQNPDYDASYPNEHDSPYCVMNQGLGYTTGPLYDDNDDNSDNDFLIPTWYFGSNPHYCDKDIAKVRANIKWGTDL